MTSRDLWKHGSDRHMRDLLSSALLSLLLPRADRRPVYFASPWMSDFALFNNTCREVAALFPDSADQATIHFSEYLSVLSVDHEVRLMTTRNPTSVVFLQRLRGMASAPQVRVVGDDAHEKGILAPGFYIDGSMNLTRSGVEVKSEKITYHTPNDPAGASRLAQAYLEFERQWQRRSAEGPSG